MTKEREPGEPVIHVHALHVGHGACTLAFVVEQGKTQAFLIDCGIKKGEPKVADRLLRLQEDVLSLLRKRGADQLDAVIVSHSDDDHTRGLLGVAKQLQKNSIPIGKVYANRDRPNIRGVFQQFFDDILAKDPRKIEDIVSATKKTIVETASCKVQILAPLEGEVIVNGGEESSNHLSAVVSIVNADTSLLVCGDAHATTLSRLADEVRGVDVLLAPHHGGDMGNSSEVEAAYAVTKPKLVVFSAGVRTTLCQDHLAAVATAGAALMCTGFTRACQIDKENGHCAGDITIELRPGKRVDTTPDVVQQRKLVQLYNPRACKDINRDP